MSYPSQINPNVRTLSRWCLLPSEGISTVSERFVVFELLTSLTGPDLQFELSRSVLVIKNAPNPLKIHEDLIKMVGIVLGKVMVGF